MQANGPASWKSPTSARCTARSRPKSIFGRTNSATTQTEAEWLFERQFRLFRHQCDRNPLDLVSMLVDDGDEPIVPFPPGHDFAFADVAGEDRAFLTRRGASRQLDAVRAFD